MMRLSEKIMLRRFFVVAIVVIPLIPAGCASNSDTFVGAIEQSVGKKSGKQEGKPPVITASFAADKGMYGDSIKVYLAAEDPDGDMEKIAVQVTQVGYESYPTSWTYLKPKYHKEFLGYLQWNTFSPDANSMPEWTRISMDITLFDREGNQSKAVVFPYEFLTGTFSSSPPPPFDKGNMPRIGWIDIDLVNPNEGALIR
jgi:hypothetical protein